MIQNRINEGAFVKDIACELNVSPKTVSRALKRGGAPTGKPGRPSTSKLDLFKPQVDDLLASNIWNAQVILRELQAAGYEGSYTILREYIQPKRGLRPGKATVRFETDPGRQLQSDWGEIMTVVGGVRTKAYFCVNELTHSRRFHVWAAASLDANHTYEAIIRAFEHFDGVPMEVLVDNQKAAVIKHGKDGDIRFNQRFIDMGEHYGFKPKACKPARPQTKGKVERMVRYVKENFFVRYRAFDSFEDLNQRLHAWLTTEADARVHGTTKQVVSESFRTEQAFLHPLRQPRFETAYIETRRVSWDAYIDVKGNRYSVPAHLAGQTVRVYIGLEGDLRVADIHDQWVAYHRLRPKAAGWATDSSHHKPLWERVVGKVQRRPLSAYEEVL